MSWTTLAFEPGAFSAIDVTYQYGVFHLASHYGRVAAFDLISPLREMPMCRDAVHALAHTWYGQCLVHRHGGELLMAAWSGGGRELAVFRLGSDGWWTEAAMASVKTWWSCPPRTAVAWLSARRRACFDESAMFFDKR